MVRRCGLESRVIKVGVCGIFWLGFKLFYVRIG